MNKYIYTVIIKSSGVAIQDIGYSRQEARAMKDLYEGMYKTKCSILRYQNPSNIR